MRKKVVDGSELGKRLKKHISNNKDVSLAVAYWGKNTVADLGLHKVENLRILCNLDHGVTNPAVIKELIDHGAEVRMHERIHAKIGFMDNLSFLGSSNMSMNGLCGGHEESNIIFYSCYNPIQKRFENLWKNSDPVTPTTLKKATRHWNKRNKLESKVAQMLQFKNSVVLTYLEASEEDEVVLQDASKRVGKEFDVFWDWSRVPCDVPLLCFFENVGGGKSSTFSWDGFWKRPSTIEDKVYDGNEFQVVQKMRKKANKDDIKIIKTAIMKASKAGKLPAPKKGEYGARRFPFHYLFPFI